MFSLRGLYKVKKDILYRFSRTGCFRIARIYDLQLCRRSITLRMTQLGPSARLWVCGVMTWASSSLLADVVLGRLKLNLPPFPGRGDRVDAQDVGDDVTCSVRLPKSKGMLLAKGIVRNMSATFRPPGLRCIASHVYNVVLWRPRVENWGRGPEMHQVGRPCYRMGRFSPRRLGGISPWRGRKVNIPDTNMPILRVTHGGSGHSRW